MIMKLSCTTYLLLLVAFFLCSLQSTIAQDTFIDNFGAISYANNDGTVNWGTNWIETGDDGNPDNPGIFNSRRIYINNGEVGFNLNQLFFIDLDGGTIERGLDLSAYGAATLTMDFDARFSGTETILVELFNNTTSTYDVVDIISAGTGSVNYTLTADQISAASRIRFSGGDNDWPNNQGIFIDNVQFTAYTASIAISDVTVSEAAGTASFTATYSGGLGAITVDYTTTDNTAYADSDYTTTSGTLSFLATPGPPQTITVPIINNVFGENDETFFITLSNPSNPSTSLLLTNGTGTITDDGDTAVTDEVPLVLFDEFDGNFDYAVTGGSLRTQDDATDPCAITTSDSSTLTSTIPAGSTIERAYLYWSHSGTAADDVVTFEGQPVTADVVNSALGGFFYGMVSDVTSIVSGLGDPSGNTYDFSGLTIDDSFIYCGTLVQGGWSLFIFYSNPTLSAATINLYSGYNNLQNTDPPQDFLLDGFFSNGSSGSKTTILSFEGDISLANNELLTVTPTSTAVAVPLNGDGDNDGTILNNPFNSTVYDGTTGVNRTTEYGLDLDTYDISSIVPTGETSITTNVDVGDDRVFLTAVILKVPSNLITGVVYEDVNYPGEVGRDLATSSGAPLENVTLELYREDTPGNYVLDDITTSDNTGTYVFGGMLNGDFRVRAVNSTVNSTRGGGSTCLTCLPVQTFRRDYNGTSFVDVDNEVGGANPSAADTPTVTTIGDALNVGAQSVSDVVINNNGIIDIDFGFNFNTIVNTNQTGQGSLRQFIINANDLDQTGLDIVAHPNDGSFNPAAGEDTSIFMIPPPNDALGRTPDSNFTSGYFDITIPNGNDLPTISDPNTVIDGRSQTVYSASTGDDNTGTFGAGGSTVGVSSNTLPSYNLPEVQVHQNNGDVLIVDANDVTIQNLSVYSNNNAGIRIDAGSNTSIASNLIGVNADGVAVQNIRIGIEMTGGTAIIENNFISGNRNSGVNVNGGTSTIIRNNHITSNGAGLSGTFCNDNIRLLSGTGIEIRSNLIEDAASIGIEENSIGDIVIISENTITNSGIGATCTDKQAIQLNSSNSSITNNIINNNGGSGIVLNGNTSGNLISQNSIFANGTAAPALGIDIANDGVTINDSGDTDTGPNGTANFPIFESITIAGNVLKVIGWSRPGATLEFFLSDIGLGSATAGDNQIGAGITLDYGEGQTYLASATEGSPSDIDTTINSFYSDVDGNTDTTNRFNFSITLSSSIPVGSLITATATIANSTSEFGTIFYAGAANVITNRKITYRVKPN